MVGIGLILAGLTTPATAADGETLEAARVGTTVGIDAATDTQRARAFLLQFGVSAATATRLVERAEAGLLSEADTPGAVPASTERYTQNGVAYLVSRYQDGSISVLDHDVPRELPTGSATPASGIGGCTVGGSGSSYTTYTGCRVRYRTHIFSFGFYVNFTQNGSYATVGKAYGKFHDYAIGHEKKSWSLKVIRERGTSANPAHVQLAIEYLTGIGPISVTINKGIRFKAHGTQYWYETS